MHPAAGQLHQARDIERLHDHEQSRYEQQHGPRHRARDVAQRLRIEKGGERQDCDAAGTRARSERFAERGRREQRHGGRADAGQRDLAARRQPR